MSTRATLSRQQLTALDRGEMVLVPASPPVAIPAGYRIEGKGSPLGLAVAYNRMPAGTVVDAIVRIGGAKKAQPARLCPDGGTKVKTETSADLPNGGFRLTTENEHIFYRPCPRPRSRRTRPRITHTLTPSSSWISGLTYVRAADPSSPSPALSSAYLVVWTKDPRTGAPRSALLYMVPPAVACKLPGLLKAGRAGDITGSGPSTGRAYWRLVRGKYPEKTVDRDAMKAILRSWK